MGKSSKKSGVKLAAVSVFEGKSGKKGKRNAEDDEIEKAVSSAKKQNKVEPVKKQPPPKKVDSSTSEEESSDSEEEKPAAQLKKPSVTSAQKKTQESDSSDSDSDDESDGAKTPTKKQSQTTGSKMIFVGNLSYSIEREQVKQFFEEAGEVVDVRLSTFEDGSFKGYGHVEFATAEAAQKALGFANHDLMGRPVRVDLALERGAYTPGSWRDNSSFKSAPRSRNTVFIEGFDTSIGEDQIRSALEEHFGSCGEITRVSIPKDYETGACKGMAYMDFKDPDSLEKAYGLNSSDLDGYKLYVDEARPRPGYRGSKESTCSSDESDDSSDESSDESDKEPPQKKPKDKTPTKNQSQTTGSKTIFVGNLSYSIEREQVKQFFEEAGEVVDVRLSTFEDGSFKGYGHVGFATAEAAQKALGFANHDLMGRPVKVDLALERGAYTRGSGSFKSAPRSGNTVYIEGFDTFIGEDQIRSALEEHFGSCGEITRVSIPKDYETGACKGMAYLDFKDPDSLVKAYQLNASDLGGYLLYVDNAYNFSRKGGCM